MGLRRRHAAWAVILAGGALLGFAGPRWREVAIRLRTLELAQGGVDAELPLEVVPGPGTVERAALDRYLRTPEGKERLLRSYLSWFDKSRGELPRHVRRAGAGGWTAIVLFWVHDGRIAGAHGATACEWEDHAEKHRGDCSPVLPNPAHEIHRLSEDLDPAPDYRLQVLQELLLEVGYDRYSIPGQHGARFSIVSASEAEKPCARVIRGSFIASMYACLIESDPYSLQATGE